MAHLTLRKSTKKRKPQMVKLIAFVAMMAIAPIIYGTQKNLPVTEKAVEPNHRYAGTEAPAQTFIDDIPEDMKDTIEYINKDIVVVNKVEYDELLSIQQDYEEIQTEYEKLKTEYDQLVKEGIKLDEELNGNNDLTYDPNDITKVSGASVKQLNKMLKGTYIEGYGQVYHDLEKKYGINAIFSISNSIQETGWDGSYRQRAYNNIYGLNLDYGFTDYNACINYWYELISKYYVGEGKSNVYNIAAKYCPPDHDLWASVNQAVAKKLINKAE